MILCAIDCELFSGTRTAGCFSCFPGIVRDGFVTSLDEFLPLRRADPCGAFSADFFKQAFTHELISAGQAMPVAVLVRSHFVREYNVAAQGFKGFPTFVAEYKILPTGDDPVKAET